MQSQDYRTNKKKPSFNNQLNMQKKKRRKERITWLYSKWLFGFGLRDLRKKRYDGSKNLCVIKLKEKKTAHQNNGDLKVSCAIPIYLCVCLSVCNK
jgi:hypothetical protein